MVVAHGGEGTGSPSACLQILRFESHVGDLPWMSLGGRLICLFRGRDSCSVACSEPGVAVQRPPRRNLLAKLRRTSSLGFRGQMEGLWQETKTPTPSGSGKR